MSIRTNLVRFSAAAVPLVLIGAAPVVSADDQFTVPTVNEGPQRLPTGSGRLTVDPAGLCGGKQPTIYATGVGTTYGTNYDDVIVGTPGDDTIMGLAGNDTICGFDGNDTIYGETNLTADVADGNDVIYGGMGGDHLYGGPGIDTIYGAAGVDHIEGDLVGSPHGDMDWIYGGNDGDHLIGGIGADRVYGDRFVNGAYEGYGNDTIDLVTDNDVDGDGAFGGYGTDTILADDGFVSSVHGNDGLDNCVVDNVDFVFTCE